MTMYSMTFGSYHSVSVMAGIISIVLCLCGSVPLVFSHDVDQKELLLRMQEEMTTLKDRVAALKEEIHILKNDRSQVQSHVVSKDKPKTNRRLLVGGDQTHKGIAFSSYMSKSFNAPNFGALREIVYDKVQCNVGNGYDNNTGSFHAPLSGIYALTWTTCAQGDGGEVGIALMINNQIHGLSYVDSEVGNDEQCSTGFTIHFMNAGDVAFTRTQTRGQGTIRSDSLMWSTFSGWLLF